jgi:O-antigen/teichoic acid export membrane protein
MPETEPSERSRAPELKRSARLGIAVLGVRSALQNVIVFVANIYLARWLDRADFGLFAILQFALSFFRLVADTGLGAALVQQKKEPDDTELSTLWWLQLVLGLGMVAASFVVARFLPTVWHTMPVHAASLLPGLAVGLLFTMLQSIPFLILERDVRFGWVGTLEFFGTVAFYGTALVLAARHAGAAAFVWASVGQAALVSVLANLVQPWKPKLCFRFDSIRGLLRFGAAFQGGNAVGFLNTAVTPLIVGAGLGADSLGVIQFSENTAFIPSIVVTIVRRVYFPFLSRLQGNRSAFQSEFEQAVVVCALPTFFFFGLFVGAAPAIVSVIYGAKWMTAVPSLLVYSFGFCFTFFSWIGDAAMAALNDMGRLFRIKVVSAITSWAATLIAIWFIPSPLSFAFGYLLQLLVTPLMMRSAIRDRLPGLRIVSRLGGVAVAAAAIAALGRAVLEWLTGALALGGYIVGALVVFVVVAVSVDADLRRVARRLLADRGRAPAQPI